MKTLEYFLCGRDTDNSLRVVECTGSEEAFIALVNAGEQKEIAGIVKEHANIDIASPVFILIDCSKSMEEQPLPNSPLIA